MILKHECDDFDGLIIDEHSPEIMSCVCKFDTPEKNEFASQIRRAIRRLDHCVADTHDLLQTKPLLFHENRLQISILTKYYTIRTTDLLTDQVNEIPGPLFISSLRKQLCKLNRFGARICKISNGFHIVDRVKQL